MFRKIKSKTSRENIIYYQYQTSYQQTAQDTDKITSINVEQTDKEIYRLLIPILIFISWKHKLSLKLKICLENQQFIELFFNV